jgi:hypothetical protein
MTINRSEGTTSTTWPSSSWSILTMCSSIRPPPLLDRPYATYYAGIPNYARHVNKVEVALAEVGEVAAELVGAAAGLDGEGALQAARSSPAPVPIDTWRKTRLLTPASRDCIQLSPYKMSVHL